MGYTKPGVMCVCVWCGSRNRRQTHLFQMCQEKDDSNGPDIKARFVPKSRFLAIGHDCGVEASKLGAAVRREESWFQPIVNMAL